MYASEYIFQVTEEVRKKSHPHREPQRAIKKQKSQIMSERYKYFVQRHRGKCIFILPSAFYKNTHGTKLHATLI